MGNCKGTQAIDEPEDEIPHHCPKGQHLIENLRLGVASFSRDYEQHYEVIRDKPLGVGLHGPVYRAVHRESGVTYANKFLCTKGAKPESLSMLKNELMIMSTMDHPNVAQLMDVYETVDGFHMIEELCTGGELHSRMAKSGKFLEEDARIHLGVMVDVIRYMHDKKIVHNDLKLENWLFENESEGALLKLIDFGFSKHTSPNEKLRGAQGSTMYMAPEMFTGDYDQQCDMWSVGVIAYMMVTAAPPFLKLSPDNTGVDFKGTKDMIVKGDYAYPKGLDLSPQATEFIDKLLVVNPHDRLTAVEAQKHDWFENNKVEEATLDEDICQKLEDFSSMTKLQQTVLQVIAYMLTPHQIGRLRQEFLKLDVKTDGKGVHHVGEVTYEQFSTCMKKAGVTSNEERLHQAFESIDFDRSGIIHWSEFLAATMNYSALSEKELQKAFDRLDCDNSGFITLENLKALVGDDISERELVDMLESVPLSDSSKGSTGGLKFEEFVEVVFVARNRKDSVDAILEDTENIESQIKQSVRPSSDLTAGSDHSES
uniref:Calmodulin n=1 Tax=Octactis speculum TaxID=3111310 RepID=A0A7S2CEC8_9STRA|mmetsp:Transcript_35004/g.47284  ORF Transcript_35004/g.47284 Transcript_35004/m.47284 type:complete len:540 (+) Transcript_35004:64-1683(+)